MVNLWNMCRSLKYNLKDELLSWTKSRHHTLRLLGLNIYKFTFVGEERTATFVNVEKKPLGVKIWRALSLLYRNIRPIISNAKWQRTRIHIVMQGLSRQLSTITAPTVSTFPTVTNCIFSMKLSTNKQIVYLPFQHLMMPLSSTLLQSTPRLNPATALCGWSHMLLTTPILTPQPAGTPQVPTAVHSVPTLAVTRRYLRRISTDMAMSPRLSCVLCVDVVSPVRITCKFTWGYILARSRLAVPSAHTAPRRRVT